MKSNKNDGPTLYFSQFGGERSIPEQFIAAIDRAEERTKVPKDAKLPPLSDEVIEARFDTRYENTNDKQLVVVKKKKGVIGPLLDFRTTAEGRSVQVYSTMFRVADTSFVKELPTSTQDVAIKDLGNGWAIQEVAVEGLWVNGNFVPGIYQGVELEKYRDDPVPNEFRLGLPITKTESIVEGTAVSPTLGSDDLRATERQIAQHKKLLSRLTREGVTLPFSLVSKRTNDKKQLVIVTDTYRLIGTAPTISTTQDIKVTDLGDGHEVATTEVISALFGGEAYTKQIEDLLPARFRGLLPTTLVRQILAGTAAMPTLGSGELRRTEDQITTLTKVVEVLARTVTFEIVVVDKATITEYGGGEVTITSKIDVAGAYSVDEGEGVVSSKITKLGEGHELKESVVRVAGAWPVLRFSRFDARLQLVASGTEQVVALNSSTPGTSGNNITEVQKIDGYRENRIITTQPISVVDAYIRVFFGNTTNVDVPPHLESLNGSIDLGGGAGSYSENGSYSLSGRAFGGGSIQLRGSAQASAVAIPELGWVVRIPKTSNIPSVHVLFYVANGTSRASIISTLSGILAATAFGALNGSPDWPDFRGQPITVKGVGGKVNIQTQVSVNAHDSVITDYLGAEKFSGFSRSTGAGVSYDVGVTTKIFNIPATIHGSLAISGTSSLSTLQYASRGVINGGFAGVSIDTGNTYAQTSGTLGILSSADATTGQTSFVGLTKHVHRLLSEPDPEFNRTRVFAEVVDFADIIP